MTIKEIANLAGVSISTVSKIVNNKDLNINPETREHVLKIVKEYNYTPYAAVKNTSSAKTFLIGVLLRTALETNLMINGIMEAAEESGYSILLLDSGNNLDNELKNITVLCKNHVDGVIWEMVNEDSALLAHHFSDQDIPFCCINSHSVPTAYDIDFTQMGYAMTQKLLEYRHRKIACLLTEGSHRSELVLEGFKKCLFDQQITYQDKMTLYVSDPEYCSKLLAHGFSGVVSSHFASSLKLYEQMSRLHYYIPSDLSLVSLKDDVRDAVFFPHISSIRIPYREFGRHVCRRLILLCERKEDASAEEPFAAECCFDTEDSLEVPAFFRSKKIVVIGSVNTDITFNVDFLPQAGKTTTILNSTTTLGGKGANQAVGAAKLGREVSLIGEIGNDTDSTLIFDVLEKEQVHTQGLHRDMKTLTGKAYIYIERDGEGTITILSGANGNLSPEHIQKRQHLFENAGFCLLSTEIPMDTVLKAAELSRQYGVKNILKPAALKTIPDELLRYTDLFIPNQKEAAALCPACGTVEDQADYFLNKGPSAVIITLGHKGCYLRTQDTSRYFPAIEQIAIDTTGGADAFISALASYLTEGYPLEACIRIATYAASFCVSRQGVVPSLVDHNTLETHIKKVEPDLLK